MASTIKDEKSCETDNAEPDVGILSETNKVHVTLTHHSQSDTSSRRFGAAFSLGQDLVASHGGQGVQTRLASLDVLARDSTEPNVHSCKLTPPQARICHTITSLNDTCALLVGGRASPSHALADCWLISSEHWTQVGDLTPARFRHSSVKLMLPSSKSDGPGVEAILVFGGKTSDGTVLDEWMLWTRDNGWNIIPADGPRPSGRYGAAMSTMGTVQNSGIVMGGMGASGVVLQDLWEWHITVEPHLQLKFFDRTSNVRSNTETPAFGRLGANLVPLGDYLLLVGGVSRHGISNLQEDFLAISRASTDGYTAFNVEVPVLNLPVSSWPLLVGTAAAAVSGNEIVLAGGGAVCFSMGSFWNTGHFSITLHGEETRPWTLAASRPSGEEECSEQQRHSQSDGKKGLRRQDKWPALPRSTSVTRIRIDSAEEFTKVLAASKPVIIENLDIGPCKDLWTLEYLKEKVGHEREIVIHECASDRMTFKDKNFSYVKKSFGDFIDGISTGAQTYLRAVSSAQPNKLPTKLEDDFPSIADDFKLPKVLSVIKETLHSTPLRVSGPVALWLHYDVLANVLCQVTITLNLFHSPLTEASRSQDPKPSTSFPPPTSNSSPTPPEAPAPTSISSPPKTSASVKHTPMLQI